MSSFIKFLRARRQHGLKKRLSDNIVKAAMKLLREPNHNHINIAIAKDMKLTRVDIDGFQHILGSKMSLAHLERCITISKTGVLCDLGSPVVTHPACDILGSDEAIYVMYQIR